MASRIAKTSLLLGDGRVRQGPVHIDLAFLLGPWEAGLALVGRLLVDHVVAGGVASGCVGRSAVRMSVAAGVVAGIGSRPPASADRVATAAV